jgi:signal transduction histidine kinase
MHYYLLLYLIGTILWVICGYLVWKKQKDEAGASFFLFTLFSSFWFWFYFLFFSGWFWPTETLLISRIDFLLSIFSGYSFLAFLYFYTGWKISRVYFPYLFGTATILVGLYIFTPLIVESLDMVDGVLRERFGAVISLHILLHIGWIISICVLSYRSISKLEPLPRIRLWYILLSWLAIFLLLIGLQLILPLFGIWILEREIIFFYILFVFFVAYTLRRYYFSPIGYGIGRLLRFIITILLTYIFVSLLSMISFWLSPEALFWQSSEKIHFSEILPGILLYIVIDSSIKYYFPWEKYQKNIQRELESLKRSIARITDIDSLEKMMEVSLRKIFGTESIKISLPEDPTRAVLWDYFNTRKVKRNYIINDIVFLSTLEENPRFRSITKAIEKNAFLIFPLYNMAGTYIGNFTLGKKRLGDFYTMAELELLREFTFFLEIHLKYIRTYSEIENLSHTLDRRVDEKTIEYNHLISRQKEFISLVSHEVRSPLSTILFQADSLISDLSSMRRIMRKTILEDLELLRRQLLRTSSLVTKIFAVEYHDTHQVTLFREKIHFPQFLSYELELFRAVHPHITLITDIDEKVWFLDIDKVQFQQVLTNLLDNAIKFGKEENPIISFKLRKKWKKIILTIEDNGIGFGDIDPNSIFDKYTTGKNKNIWLGMGLYLCKKIISMHWGSIIWWFSKKYGGALFTITLDLLPIWISSL